MHESQNESQEKFTNYTCGLIDPRLEVRVANEMIFKNHCGVLGIEVTIPIYAKECNLGNIDPQHSDGNIDLAAIEVAQTFDLPPNGASIVTVRPDLDAIGAMALIKYRASGGEVTPEMQARIQEIATADKFARGGWPGKTNLPDKQNPWPSSGSASETRSLAGIAACVTDFKIPLADRVNYMEEYLTRGTERADYRERVEAERVAMVDALEKGDITIDVLATGRIAYVVSSYRAGTSLGYPQAPVVVAFNPTFNQETGKPYKKFTIGQYDVTWVDLIAVKEELAKLEKGRGGSPTIIGSPQGVDSTLTPKEVIGIIVKHLKLK